MSERGERLTLRRPMQMAPSSVTFGW